MSPNNEKVVEFRKESMRKNTPKRISSIIHGIPIPYIDKVLTFILV